MPRFIVVTFTCGTWSSLSLSNDERVPHPTALRFLINHSVAQSEPQVITACLVVLLAYKTANIMAIVRYTYSF